MRASRLVSLLLLLQQRGQLTAAELADALEVSVRTIYRDLEALSEAGVPVYTETGPHGGARLVDGYRTRLTGLTTKEAEALFAAGVPGPAGQLGLGTVLGAAQLKLLAALPKDLADARRFAAPALPFRRARLVSRWAQRTAPRAPGRRGVGQPARRRRVPPSGQRREASTRELDPLGLVCKAGVWYLVARRADDLRTYRVSRVQSVVLLDEHFERPVDFDLAWYWSESVTAYEAQPRRRRSSCGSCPRGSTSCAG